MKIKPPSDPCNFSTGIDGYTYDQVKACYDQVAFQPDCQEVHDSAKNYFELSALRGIYDQRYGWRTRLNNVLQSCQGGAFTKDWEMHDAFVKMVHQGFRSGHVAYLSPVCYQRIVRPFIPLDFNAMIDEQGEQIIYVEAVPFLPKLYQDVTGINTVPYVGQKVVSIDGQTPVDFFKAWAPVRYGFDDNQSAVFNRILEGGFSFGAGRQQILPVPGSHVFVLEKKNGEQTTVELPWAFADWARIAETGAVLNKLDDQLRGALTNRGFALPKNTQEFVDLCLAERDPDTLQLPGDNTDEIFLFKSRLIRAMTSPKIRTQGEFQEVPGNEYGKDITILSENPHVQTKVFEKDTTVIKLADFDGEGGTTSFSRPESGIISATNYACQNSDRLILDLRNNNGGSAVNVAWLAGHLFPDEADYRFKYFFVDRLIPSILRENDHLYAYNVAEIALAQLFFGPEIDNGLCLVGAADYPGAFCATMPTLALFATNPLDIQSNYILNGGYADGEPVEFERYRVTDPTDLRNVWYQDLGNYGVPRGNNVEDITPVYTDGFLTESYILGDSTLPVPYNQPIACPGKFKDESLIVIVNGGNCSAGYFFPEALLGKATFVTTGGYLNEDNVLGSCRGGLVQGSDGLVLAQRRLEALVKDTLVGGLSLEFWANIFVFGPEGDNVVFDLTAGEFVLPSRVINFVHEPLATHRKELDGTLSLDDPPATADIQVNVWTVDDNTDGFVYRRVLKAVDDFYGN